LWSVHPGHPITGKAIYLYLTRYLNVPVTIHGFRSSVADHAVAQLKERGDPWRLNEEAPTAKLPST
jgi:hypothetical protein